MALISNRKQEDRQIWRAFSRHSRTFSLAARLLPRDVQMPIATLYLFCREIDTIADETVLAVGPDEALRILERARRALDRALVGAPADAMLWRRLAEVHERFGLTPGPLYELVEGAEWDLTGRRVDTRADLIHYANLVGGSVGAMMLPFLVDERRRMAALDAPARALGNAMQITNICRDVGDDFRTLGRIYLPREWMDESGLDAGALRGAVPPPGYAALMEHTMEAAEELYEEALRSIPGLRPAVRAGITAAGRMYREILNEVRARGYNNLAHRAFVPFRRKVRVIVRGGYEARKAALRAPAASPVRADG